MTYAYYLRMVSIMSYTYSITSKGQITLPKEFRKKLGLDKLRKATLTINDKQQIIISAPKSLQNVRSMLAARSNKDLVSDREKLIGKALAKKYDVS